MANLVYTDSQHYQDIASAIRNKNGTNNTYTPAQMAAAINALDGSGSGTPTLQSKSVSPTESIQVITPDSGYDGLDQVNVGAISSTYIGSGITQRSSTDLSTSGATVTAPAGYYTTAASKSVATMTLPTSASTTSSGTSKLAITPTTTTRYINIPTGYNETASYYTIGGDADLIAGNIKSGIQIFGVTGTYAGLDTSDATATAADILSGKTAYVNGSKITGAILNGNNIEYGLTDGTLPLVGVAQVGYTEVE